MNNLKDFSKVLGIFIWALIAIGASASALNSGEGYYMACGIANLAINGWQIYKTSKTLK